MTGGFFNSTSGAYSRSILGIVPNTNTSDKYREPAQDFYRFQELYINVLNAMRIDINRFSNGDFVNLDQSITNNFAQYFTKINNKDLYYNDKIASFDQFLYDKNVFNSYISIMNNVLNGLEKGSALQRTNNKLTQDISDNLQGIGLQLDEIVIKTFLLNRDREVIPFEESQLYTQTLEFKLWYTNYFQEWGAPPNGIFDVDKLAKIVNDLIEQGVITWEQFIADETYSS